MTDSPQTFPQLLLRHAQQRPNAVALREKEYGIWQTFTWSAIVAMVRSLAAGFAEAGLTRGQHVVVIGANRPRLYASTGRADELVSRCPCALHDADVLSLGVALDSLVPMPWRAATRRIAPCLIQTSSSLDTPARARSAHLLTEASSSEDARRSSAG